MTYSVAREACKLLHTRRFSASTGYVVKAERGSKSRQWRGLPGRRLPTRARTFSFGAAALSAEQIVEACHDAVASQSNAIALRRSRNDLRPVDIGASAEIGVHELQAERKLGRDFELDTAAQRPACVHRRSLRDDAKRVGLNAGL